MPFFRYIANDAGGARREGTVQAADAAEASRILSSRGLNVSSLVDSKTQQGSTFRTRPGTDKQRFFLFAQLAAQMRAGIAPATSFATLAAQTSHPQFAESLRRLARLTVEGASIADVMEMYPDLYPENVVGLVRAGEVGGFLPDACEAVSEQAGSAHKFRMWHWFVWVAGINALLSIPGMWLAMRALMRTWEKLDATGGMGSGLSAMGSAFWELTIWPIGPLFAVLVGVVFFARWKLGQPQYKPFRHRLGVRAPVMGKRARYENVTTFTWALGRLSRVGIAPNRSWQLAADCVPNLEMRRRLLAASQSMGADSRLSAAVFGSGLFEEEWAPAISTGELVGDVPGALHRLAEASKSQFDAQTNYAKLRGCGWGCLVLFVTSGIMMIMFFWTWYHELPAKVLQGFEP